MTRNKTCGNEVTNPWNHGAPNCYTKGLVEDVFTEQCDHSLFLSKCRLLDQVMEDFERLGCLHVLCASTIDPFTVSIKKRYLKIFLQYPFAIAGTVRAIEDGK